MIIRNENPSDIEPITQITIAAFKNCKYGNHTEQFIIHALRAPHRILRRYAKENAPPCHCDQAPSPTRQSIVWHLQAQLVGAKNVITSTSPDSQEVCKRKFHLLSLRRGRRPTPQSKPPFTKLVPDLNGDTLQEIHNTLHAKAESISKIPQRRNQ